ncbi:glyoxalase [Sphaerisporangium melleum]|uniref:Glyoxalase n=1 Tax=Sphaerisporangium melleum TaxID=321316 RepID=A0A917VW47_9ACTN|nr:VOC family protein [Sphaerisporangium melleum]GGL20090.1 glyoxalase [Sphaerisporangium melleum]GII71313.1 glyoxalase [Sphaerisporangium melleum]
MERIARLRNIVLDCPDPKALAEFYSSITGLAVCYEDDEWVSLGDGGPVRLAFQRAEDYRPPRWPDAEHPQQLHLDLTVDDRGKAEPEVLALGATRHPHQPGEPDGDFTVFLDPAGHPFCLCDAG